MKKNTFVKTRLNLSVLTYCYFCTHGEGYHPWENLISNFQTIFVLDLCSGLHHLTWRKERNLNGGINSLWRLYLMFLPSRSLNMFKPYIMLNRSSCAIQNRRLLYFEKAWISTLFVIMVVNIPPENFLYNNKRLTFILHMFISQLRIHFFEFLLKEQYFSKTFFRRALNSKCVLV